MNYGFAMFARVVAAASIATTSIGRNRCYIRDRAMTPKQLAEIWCAEAALGDFKPVWWKQIYIWAVFRISPPRLPE